MYQRILVALENGKSDASLIPHISDVAKLTGAELVLFHVADGWAARNFNQLSLAESEEIKADRAYLDGLAQEMRGAGLQARSELAMGNPPQEIVRAAEVYHCDLIAMTSHGHKLIGDVFLGSTIDKVRHNTTVPMLIVRAKPE